MPPKTPERSLVTGVATGGVPKPPKSRGKEVDTTTSSSSSLSRLGRLLVKPESVSLEILCDDMHFKRTRLFSVETNISVRGHPTDPTKRTHAERDIGVVLRNE